ncbi:MAG: hypothetical protein AB7H97_09205 [Pseudobdellovibrionaceae bacterium]
MKMFFALLTAMTVSSISHAELKPPGSFLASKCSAVRYTSNSAPRNPIYKLCFGSITGGFGIKAQQAVSVVRPIGSPEILKIEDVIPKEVMSGNGEIFDYQLINKNGDTRHLEVILENGKVVKASGKDGGASFVADQFQTVYNTMSLKTIL